MIRLIKPSINFAKEIFDYKDEMIQAGDAGLAGCGGLEKYDTFTEWINHINLYANKETLPEGYVEGSQWLLVNTDMNRVLGFVNIRHYLNDFLLKFGGHIGYSIRPSERGKGYAKQQLKLALAFLNSIGVDRVLVTCDVDNVPSYRTIEACGGVLENISITEEHGHTKRYWIENK